MVRRYCICDDIFLILKSGRRDAERLVTRIDYRDRKTIGKWSDIARVVGVVDRVPDWVNAFFQNIFSVFDG